MHARMHCLISQLNMKKGAVILVLTALVLSLSGSIAIDQTAPSDDAAAAEAKAKELCDPTLPGYIEALARHQESLDGYNKQLTVVCTPEQVKNVANVQFTTKMLEMLENNPPRVEPLQDASLLSQVGEDKCKATILLIKSTTTRIDSLVCTIGSLKAKCAEKVCGDYNAQLQAKINAMNADFKTKTEQAKREIEHLKEQNQAKINEANKEIELLKEQKKKLQDENGDLTRKLAEAKDVNDKAARDNETLKKDAADAQSKFKREIDACSLRAEGCEGSLKTSRDKEKSLNDQIVSGASDLKACNGREEDALRKAAAKQVELDNEKQKNKVLDEQAKCTAQKDQASSLTNDKETLTKDLATCNGRAKTLDDNIHTQTGTISSQKEKIEKQDAQIATLTEKAKCADDKHQVVVLNQDVATCKNEKTALTHTINQQKDQVQSLQGEISAYKKTIDTDTFACSKRKGELEAQLDTCGKSKDALIASHSQEIKNEQTAQKAALEAASKVAAEKLSACQRDAADAAKIAADKHASDVSALQNCNAKVGDLNKQLSTCDNSLNQSQRTVSHCEGLLKAEQVKFDAGQTSLKALQADSDRLRALLAESDKTIAEKQKAYDSMKDKSSELALNLNLELQTIKAARDANAKLLQEKVAQQESTKKELDQKQEDLNKRVSEIEALRKETSEQIATLKANLLSCQQIAAEKATLSGNALKQCDASVADGLSRIKQTQTSLDSCTASLHTSQGDVTILKASKSDLDSKIAALKTEISDLSQKHTSSLATCESNLEKSRADAASTKQSLSASQGTVEALKASNSAFQADIGTLKGDIAKQQSSINSLSSDLSTAKSEIQSTKQSLSQAQGNVATLSNEKSACQSEVANFKTQVAALHAKVDSVTELRIDCHNKLGTATTELASTQKNLATTQDALTALKTSKSALEKQVESLQADAAKHIGSLDTCVSNLAAAKTETMITKALLDQCTKDRNSARVDAENLSKIRDQQVQRIATLTSEVEALTLDLKKKAATIASLERDLKIETDKFDAASASLKTLQTEAAQLRSQLNVEAKALADKQAAYNQLTDKTSAEALKLKAEIDLLAASQSAKAKALQEKEAQLAILTKEVADRQADLNKRLAEIETLRKDHASATQEIAKLQHSLKTLTDLNAQAEKDLAERKALAVELQKQVDALKVSLQSCQSDASAAVKLCDARTQSLSNELQKMTLRYEQETASLAASNAHNRKAASDLVACQSDAKIHKQQADSFEAKLSHCVADKDTCNALKDTALKKQTSLEKEVSEFREMIKQLSSNHDQKFDGLLKKYSESEQRVLSLSAELAKCSRTVNQDGETIKTNTEQIKDLTKERNDLQKDLTKERNDLQEKMDAHRKLIAQMNAVIQEKEQNIKQLMFSLTQTGKQELLDQISELRREVTAHKQEMKELQAHMLDLHSQYKSAVKKIAELTEINNHDALEIRSMGLALKKYQTELSQAQSQLKILTDKISTVTTEDTVLSKQRDQAVFLAKQFRAQLAEALDASHHDSHRTKILLSIVKKLNRRIKSIGAKLRGVNAVAKRLKAIIHAQKQQISKLKQIVGAPSLEKTRILVRALHASRETARIQQEELRKLIRLLKSHHRSEHDDHDQDDQHDIRVWIARQLQELSVPTAASDSASDSNQNHLVAKSSSQVTTKFL